MTELRPAEGRRRLLALALFMAAWPIQGALDAWFERPLRVASATLARGVLRAAGVDASLEGTVLTTPGGRHDVLPACAGGRFLGATLALGLTALTLGSAGRARKWAVGVSLIPLALAGNALRVSLLILLGATGEPRLHTMLGGACFVTVAVAVAAMAGLGGEPRRRV